MPSAELETKLADTPDAGIAHGDDTQATAYRSAIPVPLQPAVPAVPAAILSQRPDVMADERALAAASAEIGVAVASRLPSLSLSGMIGINRVVHGGESDRKSVVVGKRVEVGIDLGGAQILKKK